MDQKKTITALPLTTAETYTRNWRDMIKTLSGIGVASINEIRAFNLTLAEVEHAIGIDPITGQKPKSVRFYLGCSDSTAASPADFKLIIVGVNAAGEDMLNNIGDFSHPCPTMCDDKSPLNK